MTRSKFYLYFFLQFSVAWWKKKGNKNMQRNGEIRSEEEKAAAMNVQ